MSAKEIEKLQTAINKIVESRRRYIEKVKADRNKQIQQLVNDTGADVTVNPSTELFLSELTDIEIMFNEPIAQVKEKLRLIENGEKKKRAAAIPALTEKLSARVAELEMELGDKKAQLAALIQEQKEIENNLIYRGGENGAVIYRRVAAFINDPRVNPDAKKLHLEHILNYS